SIGYYYDVGAGRQKSSLYVVRITASIACLGHTGAQAKGELAFSGLVGQSLVDKTNSSSSAHVQNPESAARSRMCGMHKKEVRLRAAERLSSRHSLRDA